MLSKRARSALCHATSGSLLLPPEHAKVHEGHLVHLGRVSHHDGATLSLLASQDDVSIVESIE